LDELIKKSHKLVEQAKRLDSEVQELARAIAANHGRHGIESTPSAGFQS
jgi:hypothetical protein